MNGEVLCLAGQGGCSWQMESLPHQLEPSANPCRSTWQLGPVESRNYAMPVCRSCLPCMSVPIIAFGHVQIIAWLPIPIFWYMG